MPRSRRGGGGGGLFGKKPASKPASNVPARRPQAAPPAVPQQQSGGMMSGLASTVAQGMAFGTGSAIAHRAVGAVAGSFSGDDSQAAPEQGGYEQQSTATAYQSQDPCGQDKTMFFDCLKANNGDAQNCQFLYEQLQTCTRNGVGMTYN
mmetsp:Transcript_684/g.1377  ORF Transcript_684/g.1377 Transcript_684/m.1377 type:complete len:149 (-) Transcript_684:163-609(-)